MLDFFKCLDRIYVSKKKNLVVLKYLRNEVFLLPLKSICAM